MRILHVNKFLYPRGGAERYMFDLARAQRRRRHQVFFFGTAHPANTVADDGGFFPPYVEFGEGRGGWREARAAAWSRVAAERLAAFLPRVKPDVAHLHNIAYHLTPSVVAALAAARVPAVMMLHDYNLLCPNHYFYSRGEPCFRCANGDYVACVTRRCVKGRFGPSAVAYYAHLVARRRKVYRELARVIAPSRWLRERVVAAGFDADRVVCLPPAIDVAETHARRRGAYFLYAGRLAPEKGVEVLVAAAGLAVPDVRLRVAGAGPAELNLREMVEKYAPRKVEFLGRLEPPALAPLMAAARAVVVPSVWPENTPAVILEAYAAGAAVVASRCGGIPEMVTDGAEGFLFEAGDVHELALILNRLTADARLAGRLGAAGRARLARDFAFKPHVDKVMALYREVAA